MMTQLEQLESAIRQRAQTLADNHLQAAQQEREYLKQLSQQEKKINAAPY